MDRFVKNKSHKGNVSVQARAQQYEECHSDGGKLFCTPCNKILDHTRKSSIDDHIRSKSHQKRVGSLSAENPDQGASTSSTPQPPKRQKTVNTMFKDHTVVQKERVKVV